MKTQRRILLVLGALLLAAGGLVALAVIMALPMAPPPLVIVQTQKHAVNWMARSGRQSRRSNDGQALDLIRLIEASASH